GKSRPGRKWRRSRKSRPSGKRKPRRSRKPPKRQPCQPTGPPAEADAPAVPAPVPARPVPAVVVKAVAPPAPDKLHIVDDGEIVDGSAHCIRCTHGRTRRSASNRARAHGERRDHGKFQSVHLSSPRRWPESNAG